MIRLGGTGGGLWLLPLLSRLQVCPSLSLLCAPWVDGPRGEIGWWCIAPSHLSKRIFLITYARGSTKEVTRFSLTECFFYEYAAVFLLGGHRLLTDLHDAFQGPPFDALAGCVPDFFLPRTQLLGRVHRHCRRQLVGLSERVWVYQPRSRSKEDRNPRLFHDKGSEWHKQPGWKVYCHVEAESRVRRPPGTKLFLGRRMDWCCLSVRASHRDGQ